MGSTVSDKILPRRRAKPGVSRRITYTAGVILGLEFSLMSKEIHAMADTPSSAARAPRAILDVVQAVRSRTGPAHGRGRDELSSASDTREQAQFVRPVEENRKLR